MDSTPPERARAGLKRQIVMRDSNGKVLRVGACVICDGMNGVAVCSIDTGEYSAEYPAAEWSYLKTGVVVATEEAGLIHWTDSGGITQNAN